MPGRTWGEAAVRANCVLTALRATNGAQRRHALIHIQTRVPLWAWAETSVTITVKGASGVDTVSMFTDTRPQALIYVHAACLVGTETETFGTDAAEGANSVDTVSSRAAPRLKALVDVSAAASQSGAVSWSTVTAEGAHRVYTDSL